MIYILFVLLAASLLVIWGTNGKEIFSVSFIVAAGFLLLVGIAITSMEFYGVSDISFESAMIVWVSIICLWIGELFGKKIVIKRNYVTEHQNDNKVRLLKINMFSEMVLIGICISAAYYSYLNYNIVASIHGLSGDFFSTFGQMRNNLVVGNFSLTKSFALNQICVLSTCIMYFLYYAFIRNLIYYKEKKYMHLLPIIPCTIISLLTTARTGIISIIIILSFITIILTKEKYGYKQTNNSKLLRIFIFSFVILVIGFRLSGLLTGKTDSLSLIENVYIYFSNALFTLDAEINNGITHSELFGRETFKYFYQILNMLGADFEISSDFFASVRFGLSGSDNIFTGLYKPLIDFSVIGLFITRFIIGLVYAWIIKTIKNMAKEDNFIKVVFGSIVMYPIVMQPIADVFIGIMNIGMLYTWFYCFVLKKVLIDKVIKLS